MKHLRPNYKKIYYDILTIKFPDKKEQCLLFFQDQKENLSDLDVIKLNKIIFGKEIGEKSTARNHRSYDKSTIFKILEYQKKNKLNNTQTAKYYGLSRNTLTKWKKTFLV